MVEISACNKADVENMLNDDEVWADTADTPKEGVEQQWKQEYLKYAIREEKVLCGKKRQLIRRVAYWLANCARKLKVLGSSPAATYVQRSALWGNRPNNA